MDIDFNVNIITIISFLFIASGIYYGIHYRLKSVEEKITKMEYKVLGNGNSNSLDDRIKHIEINCTKNHPESSHF